MLHIAVVGGLDAGAESKNSEHLIEFCESLGREIMSRGHTLLGAAQTEFDKSIVHAAQADLKEGEANKRIKSWVAKGKEPIHTLGQVVRSARVSWDPGDSVKGTPEPIERADVVILVGGYQGTRRAYWWASSAQKPVLPVTYFGGAAEEIYERELEQFDSKYARRMRKEDYEQLNEFGTDFVSKARRVVKLAEDIAHSQDVCVAMSYSKDSDTAKQLANAFDVFIQACAVFDYRCSKVTEKNTEGKITHEIVASISQAGFVIVDLTELKQNVMYELGYADGLKKSVIVTARIGTELPFDVKDTPVLFWDPMDLVKLREDLKEKIKPVANRQGKQAL